jgi:hypothetical protein
VLYVVSFNKTANESVAAKNHLVQLLFKVPGWIRSFKFGDKPVNWNLDSRVKATLASHTALSFYHIQ